MSDALTETRNLLELQRAELREHLAEYEAALPRLAVVDARHLLTQLGICLDHLDPAIPVALLARGTIE